MPVVTSASGATFSACRRWRYLLWRRWDESKPIANFLMLNPSTADEHQLDPSCTRARDFAERWGYGALIVTNLFAWRATDPADMKRAEDPVGRSNNQAILRAARRIAWLLLRPTGSATRFISVGSVARQAKRFVTMSAP